MNAIVRKNARVSLLALVVSSLVLATSISTAIAQSVRFPSIAVGSNAAGPEINAQMYRPVGSGSFPGIVVAHSCGGVGEHTTKWGRQLASWGYVALVPDSFGPRGQKSLCGRGNVVSGDSRVPDIAGALEFLRAQPFVRADRLGLIGFSHGGWTTMRAVQSSYHLANRGLRAAVAYYPYCQEAMDRDVALPLLILIGDKDDWTSAEKCRRLQAAGFKDPRLVEAVYYPNAYHGFDTRRPDRTLTVADGKSHRLGYDPVAGPDAEARTRAFFGRYLD